MLSVRTLTLLLALVIGLAGCGQSPPRSGGPGAGGSAAQAGPVNVPPPIPPQVESLLIAAYKGDNDGVRSLLDQGVDVNSRSPDGRTALIEASYWGHPDTVKLLLERKADPNARKADGATALGFATTKGYTEIVDLLKKAGARD